MKRAIVLMVVVLLAVALVAATRVIEPRLESDTRRRVLVHPLETGEAIRVPFFASTDVVRIAVHGVRTSAGGEGEGAAVLRLMHRQVETRRLLREERIVVALKAAAARTKLEERFGSASDAEAVNVDVSGEGPGELELTLESLRGADSAAVRIYRREPFAPSSAHAPVSRTEIDEDADLLAQSATAPKRSSWHRATVLSGAGGHPPTRALTLSTRVPEPPLPARPKITPPQRRKLHRITESAPAIVIAREVPLVLRASARMPVEAQGADVVSLVAEVAGVTERIAESRSMTQAAHYETGGPISEELAFFLLVPKGARATVRPARGVLDLELREVIVDVLDRGDGESEHLSVSRPPSNAAELEAVMLVLDEELPALPPRALARYEAAPARRGVSFKTTGASGHVPVKVLDPRVALAVVDGGHPRRKSAGIVRRLTPGVRRIDAAAITDLLVGDDLAPGRHEITLLEAQGDKPLAIAPLAKLPPHWIEGSALAPEAPGL